MGHRLHIKNPELYHGRENSRPYFEGWYFKQISPDGKFRMALIPGIYKGRNKEDDHSFIQVLYDNKSRYVRFPVESFRFSRDSFNISIGETSFSMDGAVLDIKDGDFTLKGEIRYHSHEVLQRRFLSPSIMGFFSYIPGMQCNHGVLSLHNSVSGSIEINGEKIETEGFIGYIEKDWGEAFPTSWLWLQGNDFSGEQPFSCMVSIATIPFGLFGFRGLIAVLMANGRQYRFATYNMASIREFSVTGEKIKVVLKRFRTVLTVTADTHQSSILKAPAATGMDRNIRESLDAVIEAELRKGKKVIFSGRCNGGGLETSETGLVSENNK
jgi:hypothetical protein